MSEILDQIIEGLNMVQRPFPKAIWFVDCPGEYNQFLDYFNALPFPEDTTRWYFTIFGIRLLPWNSKVATEEEKERAPSFCSTPGIWVEMSNGNHFQIEF